MPEKVSGSVSLMMILPRVFERFEQIGHELVNVTENFLCFSDKFEFEVNIEAPPPQQKMIKSRKIYKVKMFPQATVGIEANVQSVHIHFAQTRDINVDNKVQCRSKKFNANTYL